jgi:gluconokinase
MKWSRPRIRRSSSSQFETLEPLQPDEHGALLDVAPPVDEVARQAVRLIRPLLPAGPGGTRD